MLSLVKRVLRKTTPLEIATRELADAELAKLEAQTAQEFAAAHVSYNSSRIARLRVFIAAQAAEGVV